MKISISVPTTLIKELKIYFPSVAALNPND